MSNKEETERVAIRVPKSMKEELERRAEEEHRDFSKQVRFILSEFLKGKEVAHAD